MIKNNKIAKEKMDSAPLPFDVTAGQAQAEVNDLYAELERRFGAGFADQIIRRYTDLKPKQWEEGA